MTNPMMGWFTFLFFTLFGVYLVESTIILGNILNQRIKQNLCYGVNTSSVQTIKYKGKSMEVYCDVETEDGPWIVFLKRFNGSQDFNQTMSEYVQGFGKPSGEYWLGLENLYTLTSGQKAKLRINLASFSRRLASGTTEAYAEYKSFWIGDNSTQYTLQEISGYSGNAGDLETISRYKIGGPHKNMKFSTYDKDADGGVQGNCAAAYGGGWWFNKCHTACLTCGPYTAFEQKDNPFNMIYIPATQGIYNLKSASMMVKLPPEYEPITGSNIGREYP